MSKVTLPTPESNPGKAEWSDVFGNDAALREGVNSINNEQIAAEAGIVRSKLASDAKGLQGKWYEPKIIATEQTRESTSFGTLSTADEITGVTVPEGGLLVITYTAQVKSSVSGAGRIQAYVGSTAVGSESTTFETSFARVSTEPGALNKAAATPTVTTGRVLQSLQVGELAAGTYTVSIQYKATSGSITAKERSLRVHVLGTGAG